MALRGALKGRWTLWIGSLFFALLAGLGALMILGQASYRTTYYTITENVAARTPIAMSDVTAISVPQDGVPPTSLSQEDIESGNYFARIALNAGTALTKSVVTDGLDPLSAALAPGFVMSSLIIAPENAAGGRIRTGDYVDIAATSGTDSVTSTGKVVLQHVLVLDVAVAPETVADAANAEGTDGQVPGPNSAALYGGIPQMYTFAVSSTDFVTLALLRNANVYLALTSGPAVPSVDAAVDGATLFAPGAVKPSSSDAAVAADTTSAAAAAKLKVAVEKFIKDQPSGSTLKVVGDALASYDSASGAVLDQIALGGGTVDLDTGVFTPAASK